MIEYPISEDIRITRRLQSFLFPFLVFFAGFISPPCFSQIRFAPYLVYPTGSHPRVVSTGDMNNDGLNDVVLATVSNDLNDPANDFNLFVFYQNTLGLLPNPVKYSYPHATYSYPYEAGIRAVAIGDLNHDSLNDIAIAIYDSVGIYYQNNAGMLNGVEMIYSGNANRTDGISIGDLNDDGFNDIAVSHEGIAWVSPDEISILYRNSSGGFSESGFSAPHGSMNQIMVKDINNDLLNDVVLMTGELPGGIHVFSQNSSGSLNDYVSYALLPDQPGYTGGFDIGDLNNDGLNDIIKTVNYNSIASLLQDPGDHRLMPGFTTTSPRFTVSVKIADLNCDGKNEIIVPPAGGWDSLLVYEQNAGSTYASYSSLHVPVTSSGPQDADIGDLNHDGRKDIALACSSGLVVLLNTSIQYDSCCKMPKKPLPVTGDTLICKGVDLATFLTAPASNDTLLWFILPAGAGEIISPKKTSCTVRWNPLWTGRIRIFTKAVNSCASSSSDTLFVSIENIPHLNLGKDTSVCLDRPLILHAGNGFNKFKWQDNSSDSVYEVVRSGLYYVSASNYCRIEQDSIAIKDILLRDKPLTPVGETKICSDGIIAVYSTHLLNADTIVWHILPAQAGLISISGKDSCIITWDNGWRGTAALFAEAINRCSSSVSDTLHVYSGRMPELNLGNDTTLCQGSILQLLAGSGFDTYTWQDNSTLDSYTITREGNYVLTTTHVCGIQKDSLTVREVPLPRIQLVEDTLLCTGTSIRFDVTLPGKNRYLWQDGSEGPVYTVFMPGNYSVMVTDSNHCMDHGTIAVDELQPPVIDWPEDTTVCNGNTITLEAVNQASSYLWQDGTNLSGHPVQQSGNYSVQVTNVCGSAEASIRVIFSECSSFLDVPSAFSPNDDGLNDVLFAVGRNVDQVNFVIFDRWGQIVFETNTLSMGWNGKLRGRDLEPGVFVYSVRARSVGDGRTLSKQGNITLIR
jgi:gliding motility-associated-like protein